ncbi:hypothetical protein [Oceanobacillus locisalsi]|uniref:DNA-binding protein n=1 Tax=Oceanobacillus locisalsi TaxID=546107 RepID=A0ABW3NM04_9BACI
MTMNEVIEILHAHYIECDQSTIKKWIIEGKLKASQVDSGEYEVEEEDLRDFFYYQSTVGTAFEEGISDKVRIERLLEYVQKLEEEMAKLRWEKTLLEFELGISPFN